MNIKILSLSLLIAAFGGIGQGAIAQTPPAAAPATTFKPGFWQPVARVNASERIQMQLVNRTGFELEYALTDSDIPTRRLAVGGQTTELIPSVPAYMMINPATGATGRAAIQFRVTSTNNLITVEVLPAGTFGGQLAVTVDDTGAVYIN